MKSLWSRILFVALAACCCVCATATTAFADIDYHPNLTVGTELVGSDPTKWQQDGDFYTYVSDGYEFSVDFSSGSASDATLTLTEGDYSGYYQYTKNDALYEVAAVISVNYVFDDSLSPVNELSINSIDAGGMAIDMIAHDPNAKTLDADVDASNIYYGGIWAIGCDISLSTVNNSVIMSSEDSLTASQVRFISAESVELDAKIAMGDVSVVAQEGSEIGERPVSVYGILSMDDVTVLPDADVEFDAIQAESKNVVWVYGITCMRDGKLIVEEGATVNIGSLKGFAGFSMGDSTPSEVAGIRVFETVENEGGIFIGECALVYENDDASCVDPISAWAFGIYADEGLTNAGVIQIKNVSVSLDVAQGDPEYDQRHSIDATGIYCGNVESTAADCVFCAKPGSDLLSGAGTGKIEVYANAPNASAVSASSHGIIAWGSAEIADSRVQTRNGAVSGAAQEDSRVLLSGMHALGSITITGNSEVSAALNEEGDASGFEGSYLIHALSCGDLSVSDTSTVICDGHSAVCPDEDEALAVGGEAKLNDFATLVLWGPVEKTTEIGGGSGAIEVGDGYTVMVAYGEDPDSTQTDASLTDAEGNYYYDKYPYVRIFNQKLIPYLTIDGKRVCYTEGQNIATFNNGGTLTDIPNATWDDDTRTLTMGGTDIGAFHYAPPTVEGYDVTIVLEPGTQNRIAGQRAVSCLNSLTVQGAGELTIEGTVLREGVCAIDLNGSLTIDGGATVNAISDFDLMFSLVTSSFVHINDGTLNANSAIWTDGDFVIEKDGTLNATAEHPAGYNVSTQVSMGSKGGMFILRGTANLENMTDDIAEHDVYGKGIQTPQGVLIDGGTLVIRTLGPGITTDGADMEVTSGTVDIVSQIDPGIDLEFYVTTGESSLIISGGDVRVESGALSAVATSNLKMTGGKLHTICTGETEEGLFSIAISNQPALGEGVGVTLPEGGSIGSYANFFTVLDKDGNPVTESIIEFAAQPKPDPDPDPKPIPVTGDSAAPLAAVGMLIVSAAAMLAAGMHLRRRNG